MQYETKIIREDLKPVNFEPFKIKGVLSGDLLKVLQTECDYFRRTKQTDSDQKVFNRLYLHNPITLKAVHHSIILPLVEQHLKRKLIPSYSFLSMYGSDGKCPQHYDRPQCRYTVDLCLNQKSQWPFYACSENEAAEFQIDLAINEAAILSGTRHLHRRDDMNVNEQNFCDMAFFHFVDPEYMGELS